MKNSTILLSAVAALALTTSLRADDQQWQRQRDTQRWAAERAKEERVERAPTVALYVHNSGVGENKGRRDSTQRSLIQRESRSDRSFYHSTPQDPRSDY